MAPYPPLLYRFLVVVVPWEFHATQAVSIKKKVELYRDDRPSNNKLTKPSLRWVCKISNYRKSALDERGILQDFISSK